MLKFAHGDVILNQVKAIPKGAAPKKGGVLQHGERTGHAHRLYAVGTEMGKAQPFQLYEQDGQLFAEIKETTALRHEEHKEILLSPGAYKVGIIREFDPFEKVIRNVVD
jgi:hypothetical protein